MYFIGNTDRDKKGLFCEYLVWVKAKMMCGYLGDIVSSKVSAHAEIVNFFYIISMSLCWTTNSTTTMSCSGYMHTVH